MLAVLLLVPYLVSAQQGWKVDNPYATIDWNNIQRIPSTTHIHVNNQEELEKAYHDMGLRHLPISNYYPSAPYYPLDSLKAGQFRVVQNFSVRYKTPGQEGSEYENIAGPLYWNDILTDPHSGWHQTLPQDLQNQLPFRTSGRLFHKIPADLISSPNAEHHSFTNSALHANGVGSTYASGTFDSRNRFGTVTHGYHPGTGLTWQEGFELIIDHLHFADAGGITINHPVWSHLSYNEIVEMLQFDTAVLGIEIFNDPEGGGYEYPEEAWAIELWDQILGDGYRCFGFCVPDHTLHNGQSILLVSEPSEYACLKAYRQGSFYGALRGSGLGFEQISLDGINLHVRVNARAKISIITDQGRKVADNTYSLDFTIPTDPDGLPQIQYLRIEAQDTEGERIFSQPIRFIKSQ